MDIPKTFIPENENILEERIRYLLKEHKLEPTEMLEVNGKLYVAFTHPSNRKAVMERNLDYYLFFSDKFKIIELVEHECYKKSMCIVDFS